MSPRDSTRSGTSWLRRDLRFSSATQPEEHFPFSILRASSINGLHLGRLQVRSLFDVSVERATAVRHRAQAWSRVEVEGAAQVGREVVREPKQGWALAGGGSTRGWDVIEVLRDPGGRYLPFGDVGVSGAQRHEASIDRRSEPLQQPVRGFVNRSRARSSCESSKSRLWSKLFSDRAPKPKPSPARRRTRTSRARLRACG